MSSENIVNALAENLGAGNPEGTDVEDDGDDDAKEEAKPGDVHCAGDEPGGQHHGKGEEEEGDDVLQGMSPVQTNKTAGTGLQHEDPCDFQGNV